MRRLVVPLVVLVAGCGGSADPCAGVTGACVALTVEASAPVDTLQITAFGQMKLSTGRGSPPIHLALVPPAGTPDGPADIHVEGSFAGVQRGTGDTTAVLAGKGHVNVTLTLATTGGGDTDLGGDIDLSGVDLAGTTPCTSGQDCSSMLCNQTTHVCASSTCDDGLKDGNETDIDCGGPTCAGRCAVNQVCSVNTDCGTGSCTMGFCQKAALPAWLTGPPLPAWFTTGTIIPGRADGATISTGGTIYVIAGWGQTSGTGQEKYVGHMQYINVAAGDTTWSEGDSFGVNQGCNGNVGGDGQLWLSGGGSLNPNTHLYSHPGNMPTGSTWTQFVNGDPPIQRSYFAAPVGPEGWIYQLGGGSNLTWAWDATNKLWQTGPNLSVDRSGLGAALGADGNLYAMGGVTTAPTNLNEQLDLTAKVLNQKRVMPVSKAYFGMAAAPDGRIYVIGGTQSGNQNQGLTSVEVYTPATDSWTTAPNLTHARSNGAAVIAPDGRIWMIAGYSPDTAGDISPFVEIYGPDVKPAKTTVAAGETISATGMNFGRNAAVTVSLGNSVIGGGTSDANGQATLSLTVPAGTTAGTITLKVRDDKAQYPVTVGLTVM